MARDPSHPPWPKRVLGRAFRNVPPLTWVVVATAIVATQLSPYFLTTANVLQILKQSAVLGVLSLGLTILMISGAIDLSVGSTMSFVGISAGKMLGSGQPTWVVVLFVLAAPVLIALLQGTISILTGVHSFVVTLGGFSALSGLALYVANGLSFSIGSSLDFIGYSSIAAIPTVLVILAAAAALTHGLLHHSRLGRNVFAVGGNAVAAHLAGIRVWRTRIAVTTLAGAAVGVATLLLLARTGTASPTMGAGYEILAITAVVIGGTQLSGGRGSMLGTLLGVLLIEMISNALVLRGVSLPLQSVTVGALLVLAAASARLRANGRT